jgi:hypothetical protein
MTEYSTQETGTNVPGTMTQRDAAAVASGDTRDGVAVVHRASPTAPRSRALAPGIEALDVPAFVDVLRARPRTRRSRDN